MRVRLHGKRVDVDRQGVPVGVDVVAASGSNIDVLPSESQHVTGARRTFFREKQSDAHLYGFGHVPWHEVELDDEIALGLETPAHTRRRVPGRLARRPSKKHPVGKSGLAAAASLVPHARLVCVATSRETRPVDFDIRVVHNLRIPWAEFHGFDVRGSLDGNRDDEGAKHIAPLSRQHVGFRHLNDDIRRAERPCVRPRGSRGHVGVIAADHPLRNPTLNRGDIRIGHAPVPLESSMVRLGFPRRHIAVSRYFRDALGARAGIFIGQKAERC